VKDEICEGSFLGGGDLGSASADAAAFHLRSDWKAGPPGDLVEIVSKGGKETGFVLQVYGYWDMVCAFVLHGMLSEGLVYDTCQEMYFQYAKIQPYVEEFRQKMNLPEWMRNIERVVEGSEKGRKRITEMRKNRKW
jgi:hypothetical protein